MTAKLYTRKGDKGETGLVGGGRYPKDDLRVGACGDVDELNAAIGLVLCGEPPPVIAEPLLRIQSLLFEVGAEIATPPGVQQKTTGVVEDDLLWLEGCIDSASAQVEPLKCFVLPGGAPVAAALHLARCVCRRAERTCVALRARDPETSPLLVRVLNRLSDLLFALARQANAEAGAGDVPWRSRSQ